MGVLNYLKPGTKKGKKAEDEKAIAHTAVTTAAPSGMTTPGGMFGDLPSPGFATPRSPNFSGTSTPIPYGAQTPGGTNNAAADLKCEVIATYIYQKAHAKRWISQTAEDEGVIVKKTRDRYTAWPPELAERDDGIFAAISQLNVRVAMTINTSVINILVGNATTNSIVLCSGLRVQVIPDITYLPSCQKHQSAAFIADRALLVVWDDDSRNILKRAEKMESQLLETIWQEEEVRDEKKGATTSTMSISEVSSFDEADQTEAGTPKSRPIMLLNPIGVALTLCLIIITTGLGWRNLGIEIASDQSYTRLALLAVWPIQIWASLFFFQCIVCNLLQLFGPVSQMKANTKFYSGLPPKRLHKNVLPHVTIQMPVYKEGLVGVIEPTIKSIKAAISTYEMQGGTANIFINDDGMQLISEDEAAARQDFYDEHNIGWVARPKHNPKPAEGEEAFIRAGKFKKASNMNYAMWVSTRIEDKMNSYPKGEGWTPADEALLYAKFLTEVCEEDEGRTWADGNVRIGDYILIIDSDTRVPTDCFLDAVSEMDQSPQVGILQFSSGVMNVTDSFFETAITFFTNLIYTQIKYAVANGDVAPFVGHNAILRWSAVQDIVYDCPIDKREKWWSEATVSEDFDMALRLQAESYIVRLGAYYGDGFKEGVSLTVYDELARWEKYAYGCSELIFWPFKDWFRHGPFTPLFRKFIASPMPLGSKFTIMAYIGTYYAIGAAYWLTLLNYFLVGWFNGALDHYYLNSFAIFFAIIIIFNGLGNLALGVVRYRTGEKALLPALWECFKWIPVLAIFIGGLSLHVSQAILSHLFSIDMQWGATSKEATDTTFFDEIPMVLRKFKYTFIINILVIAMMAVLHSNAVPWEWQIDLFIAIGPMSFSVAWHMLLPIVLNPVSLFEALYVFNQFLTRTHSLSCFSPGEHAGTIVLPLARFFISHYRETGRARCDREASLGLPMPDHHARLSSSKPTRHCKPTRYFASHYILGFSHHFRAISNTLCTYSSIIPFRRLGWIS